MTPNDNRQGARELEDALAETLWKLSEGLRAEFAARLAELEGRVRWVEQAWHITHTPDDEDDGPSRANLSPCSKQ